MRTITLEATLLLAIPLVMATPINLAARQECSESCFTMRQIAEICPSCLCTSFSVQTLETCVKCSTEGLDCDGDGKLLIQAWNEAIDVFNSICSNPNINSPLSFTVPELEPPSTTLAATYSASTTTNVDAYGAATAAPPSVFTSAAGVNSDDDDIHPADEDVADECSLELKEILQPAPREPSPGSGTTLPPSRGAGRVILPTSSTTPGPAQTPARALLTVTFITDGAPPTTGSASRSSGTPQAQATVVTGDEPETVADSDTTYTPTLRLTPTPASMVVVSTITSSGLTSTVLTTIVRTLPADPGSGEMVQIASSRVERPLRPNTRPAVAETPMEDSAISQRRSGSSATSASVPTAGTKLDSDESDASRGRYSISRISSPVAVAFLFIILHALS